MFVLPSTLGLVALAAYLASEPEKTTKETSMD